MIKYYEVDDALWDEVAEEVMGRKGVYEMVLEWIEDGDVYDLTKEDIEGLEKEEIIRLMLKDREIVKSLIEDEDFEDYYEFNTSWEEQQDLLRWYDSVRM